MTALADRLAILELNARYNWACYDRDPAAYAACFTPDGVYESGNTGDRHTGAAQLAAGLAAARDSAWLMGHVTADAFVEVNGETARQRVFVLLYRREDPHGENQFFASGTYTDDLTRSPSGWLYRQRTSFIDRSYLPWARKPVVLADPIPGED